MAPAEFASQAGELITRENLSSRIHEEPGPPRGGVPVLVNA